MFNLNTSNSKLSNLDTARPQRSQKLFLKKVLQLSLLTSLLGFGLVACSTSTEVTESNSANLEKSSVNADNSQSTQASEKTNATAPIETVERVVALTSLSADLVATLEAERLVGIPGSSLIAQDSRFASITTVSEGRTEPDLETIVSLSPDLVIGAKGLHDKALQKLSELGIATMTVKVDSWESLRELTKTLAAAVESEATPILERYDACLADVPEKTTSTLVLVSRQPLLSPNKNSWAGDFLAQMNIQNLSADLQGESPFDGYITLSAEKVIEANPDSLIIVNTPREDTLAQLKEEPFWSQLKATQADQVWTTEYFGLVNPGSLASIETACRQLKQIQ